MLELKNIQIWFGKKQVLKNISCKVQPGDFIVIVGANGAGKSTLFDTISGKTQPTEGRILLDGCEVTHLNESQRASFITRIFQNTGMNSVSSMTVAQNLSIAQYSRRSARFIDGMHALPRQEAERIISDLGMNPAVLDQKMQYLSGGQRQLIAFGMATQRTPKLLLLDEPTAALDPQAATTLLSHAIQFIKKHAVTTLLITHDPEIALSVGNKVWVVQNGALIKEFDKEEKKGLSPRELIGQIDYAHLASAYGT